MKAIKLGKEVMLIDKDYENYKLLNCDHIICDFGSLGVWDCTYCPFKNDRNVNISDLNIIEVEI